MANTTKRYLLHYSIPGLMLVVIIVQFFFVHNKRLSKWKGGGYGMYTEIHYSYNQIYIDGMSADSLAKDEEIKEAFKFLKLMPNRVNLKEVAELISKKTKKNDIHMQIWKPTIDSKNGNYTRVLVDEIQFKNLYP